jgi:hypothetical protein
MASRSVGSKSRERREKDPPVKDRRSSDSALQSKLAKAHRASSPSEPGGFNHNKSFLSDQGQNVMIFVLLAAATVSGYLPVHSYPFVNFDDNVYVIDNPHVNSGLNWENFRWAWTTMTAGNWHPLTWLSHALDCQIFGLYAGGHHLTNVILHSLNAMLLFWLLNKVSGARWRSAMVAALFALHPLNVESVAWVAERKNLLSTLFFLLALGAYGWHARNPQIKRYLIVGLLLALGLASKPMVINPAVCPVARRLVAPWKN